MILLGCAAPPEPERWTALPQGEGWPDEAGDAIPVPTGLDERLADVAAYGRDGTPTTRSDAGSFGVGNGVVFGIIGLDDPVNTLTNAIGPGYDVEDGFFGDSAFALDTPVTAARVQRVRGTAVVRTWEEGEGVRLTTTSFTPPGEAAIVRYVTVDAEREGVVRWTVRRAEDEAPEEDGGVVQTRGARRTRLSCDTGAPAEDGWEIPFSTGEQTLRCEQVFTTATWPDVSGDLTDAFAAADGAFADAMVLELPDPKVEDLYDGMLVTAWTQTTSGLVSPMSRYTRAWLRDTEGPVRLWLRAGLHEEALTTLEAVWRAQIAEGGVQNSFSTGLDLDEVSLPEDPETWWADATFMDGREPVEAPSFPVLLHAAATDWTGETWDEQRAAFLDACVDRQVFDGDVLPFSGDETFRWPMASALGSLPEELGWSANSTFLWRAAAATRGRDPEAAPLDPYWTGEHWAPILDWDGAPLGEPYEDVALQPAWWDAGVAEGDLDTHLDTTAATLLQADGTLLSPLAGGDGPNIAFTGMVPGFWLHAVASRHRPEEASAFAALDLVATPSGHFEELHGQDLRPLAVSHDPDGRGADVTARYRPWEGGDVVAALLDYLLGAEPDARAGSLRLSPHLPPGWPSFTARGLRVGEHRLEVTVESWEEGERVTLSGAEGLAVTVVLHGERAFAEVWADGERTGAAGELPSVRVRREVIGVYE